MDTASFYAGHTILNYVTISLNFVGVGIILWGLGASIAMVFHKARKPFDRMEEARVTLSSHLLLSLEVFISSDIISTVMVPTWERLGMLGGIVFIRTLLSYILTKEMKERGTRGSPGDETGDGS